MEFKCYEIQHKCEIVDKKLLNYRITSRFTAAAQKQRPTAVAPMAVM